MGVKDGCPVSKLLNAKITLGRHAGILRTPPTGVTRQLIDRRLIETSVLT
jgi:hypothetical protein